MLTEDVGQGCQAFFPEGVSFLLGFLPRSYRSLQVCIGLLGSVGFVDSPADEVDGGSRRQPDRRWLVVVFGEAVVVGAVQLACVVAICSVAIADEVVPAVRT